MLTCKNDSDLPFAICDIFSLSLRKCSSPKTVTVILELNSQYRGNTVALVNIGSRVRFITSNSIHVRFHGFSDFQGNTLVRYV